MRSFRSMKYQILAAAALLLSGPYITAAADPADQAEWSESVPVDEERHPGERIEAYIVDGRCTPAASIKTTFPFGTSFSPKPTRTNLLLSNTSPPPSKCATPTACTLSATPFGAPL